MKRRAVWLRATLGLAFFAGSSATAAEDRFLAEVKPIFEKRCAVCHSAQVRSGGLVLASRREVLAGGNRGPAVAPGRPDESLLIEAVRGSGALKMPPGGKLPSNEIAALERWVRDGAKWTASEPSNASAAGSAHWSFRPVQRPAPPAVARVDWARNPIDRFILARLESAGLAPSPEAVRATLIRRLSLDLTGLLPSPEETEAFLADSAEDAYERLVERLLLSSPHYGERWGRHWLDIARYADSNGYSKDDVRQVWMYREWVIEALNRDLPFDRFVIEQIAGDMLPEAKTDQKVATGFYRNTLINLEGGIDFEQYRVEAVVDRVATTGAAFLGLTLGCARCHEHKYDPVSQREFYQFYAFFNNIDELSAEWGEAGRKRAQEPTLEFGTPEELTRRDALKAQIALLEKELSEYAAERRPRWERSLSEQDLARLKPEVRESLATPAERRNSYKRNAVARAFRRSDIGYQERKASIVALEKRLPKLKTTMVMRELTEPRQAYIHLGGDFLRKGAEVEANTPAALPPLRFDGARATRLDLARWLVSDENPLTSRVTVNRVWQRYFGLGIVETEDDFGTQGSPPSHPELLDWLASEFRDKGWSLKKLHRLIVRSATYRQSSRRRGDAAKIDPRNRLLARQNRLRLESEIIRDAALSASGLLNPAIGGPSVFPPQPAGASKLGQMQRDWVADTDGKRYRRGLYTFFWRASPHPGLMIFDSPDSMASCTRRVRSNTPLQALTLLNDEAHYEFARALAERVMREEPDDPEARLERAFRICLTRPPEPAERDRLLRFLLSERDAFETSPEAARLVAAEAPSGAAAAERAAWTALARVLLNLDEFITRE